MLIMCDLGVIFKEKLDANLSKGLRVRGGSFKKKVYYSC